MVLSLWLTLPPDAPINDHLIELIKSLPAVHPSLASSPIFMPHITLTSQIPDDNTDISSLDIPPFLAVSIKHLTFGNAYFKKVYFTMDRSHELLQLAQEARIKFNGLGKEDAKHAVEKDYDPHLSLLYNDVDIDHRLKVAVEDKVTEQAEHFGFGSWEGKSWEGGQVVLVRTEGAVEQWKVLPSTEIGGSRGHSDFGKKDH